MKTIGIHEDYLCCLRHLEWRHEGCEMSGIFSCFCLRIELVLFGARFQLFSVLFLNYNCDGMLTCFQFSSVQFNSVQFSSVQYVMYAPGKTHIYMRSTPSLGSFPNVAFETVPMFLICNHKRKKIYRFEVYTSIKISSLQLTILHVCCWLCDTAKTSSSERKRDVLRREAHRLSWPGKG